MGDGVYSSLVYRSPGVFGTLRRENLSLKSSRSSNYTPLRGLFLSSGVDDVGNLKWNTFQKRMTTVAHSEGGGEYHDEGLSLSGGPCPFGRTKPNGSSVLDSVPEQLTIDEPSTRLLCLSILIVLTLSLHPFRFYSHKGT